MRLYLITIFSLLLGTAGVAQTVSYKNISAVQADTLIRNHMASSDLVILDVRTSAEFSFERIDKSKNADVISVSAFNDSIDRMDKNKIYLVYCATGTRSPGASTKMQNKNFKNVYNMQGGISAWKREGYPTIKGIGTGIYPYSIDNLIVKIYPNPVVDLSTIEVDGFLEGEVKIEILNALGSLVLSQKMVPGRAITLNGRELSPGLYFYRLILPQNQVKSGRFQVAR